MQLSEKDLAERIGLLMFQLWALDKELLELKTAFNLPQGEFSLDREKYPNRGKDARDSSPEEIFPTGQGAPARP